MTGKSRSQGGSFRNHFVDVDSSSQPSDFAQRDAGVVEEEARRPGGPPEPRCRRESTSAWSCCSPSTRSSSWSWYVCALGWTCPVITHGHKRGSLRLNRTAMKVAH